MDEQGDPVPVAVALGSNRGDREAHLRRGLRGLAEVVEELTPSPVYRTRPVGEEGQPWFLNMCAAGRTRLPPRRLLERLLEEERAAGRERTGTPGAGPRTLDLDLLLYDDRVIREPGLRVPHPRMTERGFVLVPLSEIVPGWRHPEAGRTVEELRRRVDETGVERWGRILGG